MQSAATMAMRTRVWFHGRPEDLDRMEAEVHAWKLDRFVASSWRVFWFVLVVLVLGEVAGWLGA
jgi:hypothetical protein